jgi:hypothetical protein
MDETAWLACTDPEPMLEFLRSKVSDRKLRLFACACCRGLWDLIRDARTRMVVEANEQFTDGLLTEEELVAVHHADLLFERFREELRQRYGFPPTEANRLIHLKFIHSWYLAPIEPTLVLWEEPEGGGKAAAARRTTESPLTS